MPTPQAGESRDDWIERCMGDEEAITDFPDTDRRYAFCVSRFEGAENNSNAGAYAEPGKYSIGKGMEYKNASFEVKELGKDGEFVGYASVFGNIDQGGDIVEANAFDEALKPGARMPKMLWQHDPGKVIGVYDKMHKDANGLIVQGRLLTEVQRGKEAHVLMRAGAIDGLSIGYQVQDDEFVNTERGSVRKIKRAKLWEVSVVTFPMNEMATVQDVKNLQSPREVERILRDAGVPNAFAKLVAIHGFEEATSRLRGDHRDDGDEEARAQLETLHKQIMALKETFHG